MRITSELLFKIAHDTVTRRARRDRNLLAVYAHGSLLESEPLLGGTTDIDLFFIHDDRVGTKREIQRLTDEVHLDIAHHEREDYQHARELRTHPWLGPTIFGCNILYDPRHFMDFTQAIVRAQFYRPEYVIERARKQAENARQIWLSLYNLASEAGLDEVVLYLRGVQLVANAIACLSGPPLTDRRLLARFPACADAIGHSGLYFGLLGLLGAPHVDVQTLVSWLPVWESAYQTLPEAQAPAKFHPHRRYYYLRGFEQILQSERPHDVLWPLLQTWTLIAQHLPPNDTERLAWNQAFIHLGLYGDEFPQRVAALDVYLDTVDEILEEWARANGVAE